jgi:DHA1 family tetracycline resistance protein-like MFS transporter
LQPPPPDPRASRVTALVFFVVFLDLIGFGLIIPLLPFYVQRFGGSASTVGTLFASFSVAQFFTTPLLGRVSDRVGRRPVILVSLLGNAVAMGVFAAATEASSLTLIFVSRLLAGATAGNLAACQASIADVTRGPERAASMGRVGAGIGLGLVAGPLLSGELSKLSPSAPALGAAALALVGVAAAFFFFPETHVPGAPARSERSPDAPPERVRDVLRRGPVVAVLALYFLVFFALTQHQATFTLLAAARFSWTEVEVGRSFALLGLVMFLVQGWLLRWLTMQASEGALFCAGSLVAAVGMGALGLATQPLVLLAGLVLMAAGFGLTQPTLSAIASRHAGEEHQGAVLGVAQSSGGLARSIGPLLAGYLFEHLAPGSPYAVGAGAFVLCLLLGWHLSRTAQPA